MEYATIDINFDSLGVAYGFPKGYKDPSFFEVSERFFEISDKYKFKYSIYIVGKDLEKAENCERVREWSIRGHEIGNHSWSHPINLGAMKSQDIYREVKLSHDIIRKTIGHNPAGFISPIWSTSPQLIETLISLNYSYDTSSFPSWLMYPLVIKYLFNHLGSRNLSQVLNRKDHLLNLFGPRNMYQSNGSIFSRGTANKISIVPVPTNRYRVACWHTIGFLFGWKFYRKILESTLKEIDAFYYVIHPADLMDKKDFDPNRTNYLERAREPLKKKMEYLEQSIQIILDSGRKIVTMDELVRKYRRKNIKDARLQ